MKIYQLILNLKVKLGFLNNDRINRFCSVYWAARSPLVLPILKTARPNSLLDIGCNTGFWSRCLSNYVQQVVGVDLDLKVLKIANLAHSNPVLNPNYVNASATNLPFTSSSFSTVTCLDMLDIVPNDKQALEEIFRVLQPGGIIIITVMSRQRRHYLTALAFSEHLRNYSRDELRELLTQVGFVVQSETTFYRTIGKLAREVFELSVQRGLDRYPILRLMVGCFLAALTRLDQLMPSTTYDGGFGFVACKPALVNVLSTPCIAKSGLRNQTNFLNEQGKLPK